MIFLSNKKQDFQSCSDSSTGRASVLFTFKASITELTQVRKHFGAKYFMDSELPLQTMLEPLQPSFMTTT